MEKLISSFQSAFLSNRKMFDGVLVINELMKFSKRFKKSCSMVKVDFKKSYDCVSWEYLMYLIRGMGFGSKWLAWKEALVFNSSMFFLVNGSPTG